MCINKTGDGGAVRRFDPRLSSLVPQHGISLVELIMFIVIVGVALAGILLVMNTVTKSSADPVIHKQTLAIAESLLEEIELQDFTPAAAHNAVTLANRATNYHVVMDYDGFSMPSPPGIFAINDPAVVVPGLAGYSASAVVQAVDLGTILAPSAVGITVTVRAPSGETIEAVGYRVAY